MRHRAFIPVVFAVFLSLAEEGWAHKVNVFAFVDGSEIQVECSFSKSRKVKNGKLAIIDLETGDMILEGETDERGMFRFRPPDAFLSTGHGLVIRLAAGEGHQDEWRIAPEELRALSRTGAGETPMPPSADAAADARQDAPAAGKKQTTDIFTVDAAGLEAIIGRVVDAKLAPVKQALARQRDGDPGLRDIVGGLGWILGLLGLATYMKHRR